MGDGMTAKEWRLDQLFGLFPDISRGTRRMPGCVAPAKGEGTWVKGIKGTRQLAGVVLQASPARAFSFRCIQSWPETLRADQIQALERGLLQGVLEGTVQCEDPPWACQLECTSVTLSSGATAMGVRTAARLAVQDLVHHGEWEAVGSPGDHVA
jgi:hypothetical protein